MTLIEAIKEDVSGASGYSDDRVLRLANESGQYANSIDYGFLVTTVYSNVPYDQYQIVKYYIAWQVCQNESLSSSAGGESSVQRGYTKVSEKAGSATDTLAVCEDYKKYLDSAVTKLYPSVTKSKGILFATKYVQ